MRLCLLTGRFIEKRLPFLICVLFIYFIFLNGIWYSICLVYFNFYSSILHHWPEFMVVHPSIADKKVLTSSSRAVRSRAAALRGNGALTIPTADSAALRGPFEWLRRSDWPMSETPHWRHRHWRYKLVWMCFYQVQTYKMPLLIVKTQLAK